MNRIAPIALLHLGHNALGTISPQDLVVFWHLVDWQKVIQIVRNLQGRIVKAVKNKDWKGVRALQRLLTHSMSAKLLAIRQVSTNRGASTAGVPKCRDKVLWNNPAQRCQAVYQLRIKGYKSQPVRLVKIPKKNGKWRKLGIPTIKDRAMQALYLLALDPISETLADPHSYGFRRYRSCADAIEQCFNVLSQKQSPRWILEADIKGCFDNISHEWLLKNIPLPKSILQTWLQSGQVNHQKQFSPTTNGTPQGAIISPTLANMTLDGLQKHLYQAMGIRYDTKGTICHNPHQVHLVRYADDFIITANDFHILQNKVQPIVQQFLKVRGLTLSQEKTNITHIKMGFDFLGKTIRKFGDKLLIKPSKKSMLSLLYDIRKTVKSHRSVTAGHLIELLNPKIKGWAMYYRTDVAKQIFSKIDSHIWRIIWKWCVRRHPKKNKQSRRVGIKDKYFTSIIPNKTEGWHFHGVNNRRKTVYLFKMAKVPIQRHIKIRKDANPYDGGDEMYFENRLEQQMLNKISGRTMLRKLYNRQLGKCEVCQLKINQHTGWHIHHIIPKWLGGTFTMDNLVVVHPICHRQIHFAPTSFKNFKFKLPRPQKTVKGV